eukprot:6447312-Pyramimonas_sp.AAC.2
MLKLQPLHTCLVVLLVVLLLLINLACAGWPKVLPEGQTTDSPAGTAASNFKAHVQERLDNLFGVGNFPVVFGHSPFFPTPFLSAVRFCGIFYIFVMIVIASSGACDPDNQRATYYATPLPANNPIVYA